MTGEFKVSREVPTASVLSGTETFAVASKAPPRLNSIDCLRGLVMVLMLLDHTREFVHAEATRFTPTDLSQTSVFLFLTRWVTHFCAPTFVLLAGTSAYLRKMRGTSSTELALFLMTRGLWLIVLEFTLVRFSILFNVDYQFLGLAEVIWAIGVSMIALSGLAWLPTPVAGFLGVAMMALHNLLDGISVPPETAMAGTPPPDTSQKLWLVLHQPGFIPVFDNNVKLFVAYPLIPWIGVMAAGYGLGAVYRLNSVRRRKWLGVLGAVLVLLFALLRTANVYGDPSKWERQSSAAFTLLSFLNVTKYPASLLFLMMTLGLALLILAWSEGNNNSGVFSRTLITFGRVPLFYFVLQMMVAHGLAVLLSVVTHKNAEYLFLNFPTSSTNAPPDSGFSLAVVYATWIGGLLILYPLCRWFGRVKQSRMGFPFSYL
jgi:uncharacterized membrane protein